MILYRSTTKGRDRFVFPFLPQLHVCRHWRDVALHTHSLWDTIFDNNYNHLRPTFIDLVALKVERSHSCAMTVEVIWEDDYASGQLPALVEYFLQTLLPATERL
ncbi:hypothetical protein FRB93_000618 [Tulasnella sp. JGI-2019a]|nr:hypothetical protein FRB93_000618 [Tulasnella sp. JGI-2019a]